MDYRNGDKLDGNTQSQAVQQCRSLIASGEAAKNAAIYTAKSIGVFKRTLSAAAIE
ncbi:hypothetical protein ACVDG5_008130 [Mesorhizobium sp. ORM6]